MKRRPLTEAKRLLMRKAMELRPHSYAELVAIADLDLHVVYRHIAELRACKTVHIGARQRTGAGRDTLLFAWGNKPDVKPSPALTAAQRMAASRARRKELNS